MPRCSVVRLTASYSGDVHLDYFVNYFQHITSIPEVQRSYIGVVFLMWNVHT